MTSDVAFLFAVLSLVNSLSGTNGQGNWHYLHSNSVASCCGLSAPHLECTGGIIMLPMQHNKIAAGLILLLRGRCIVNGSDVNITDIDRVADNTALECITDKTDCCNTTNKETGEWQFPDGSLVLPPGGRGDIFRVRKPQKVLLGRRRNAMGPLGRYCCIVDTMATSNAAICINMSKKYCLTFHCTQHGYPGVCCACDFCTDFFGKIVALGKIPVFI